MSQQLVLIKKKKSIALVTLNRPKVLNAISKALRDALIDAFHALAKDKDIQAIILTGAGRAFCAGVDLKELGGKIKGDPSPTGTDISDAIKATPQTPLIRRF